MKAILRNAGFRVKALPLACRGWLRFVRDRRAFRARVADDAFPWGRELPILTEWEEESGGSGACFLQDLTVDRWIHRANPVRHVDVGSRIDGFVGSLAAFREVEVIDIREAPPRVPGILFHQLDMMRDLPVEWKACTDSLSCLHTIEHFGLGRYGDPIDPEGHLKGLANLTSMVKPGGRFYLSTPIGPQRVEFNAHRVFSPETMLAWFEEGWEIERCAVIDDEDDLEESSDTGLLREFGGQLGVGVVVARKTAS